MDTTDKAVATRVADELTDARDASAQHLYEVLQQRADTWPDAVAVGGQDGLGWKTLTSRQLLEAVDALAEELRSLGVGESDRVVLWVPNHWRTPVYLFALWKLGAIVVPFDREMNPSAGAAIIRSIEPRCIIAGHGERPAWASADNLTEWWDPQRGPQRPGTPGGHPKSTWHRPAEELAALFFTSGTTGEPKGCMITHHNLCWQLVAVANRIPLDPTCRFASILPLSHLYELTGGLLYPIARGAAVHYIPSRRGSDILRVLSEQRITHMMVVPQLLTMVGHALDQQLRERLPGAAYSLMATVANQLGFSARRRVYFLVHRKLGGQLRILVSGGAALPLETQRLWERMGVRVIQGYGASECSPSIALSMPDGSTPIGSVGRPLDGIAVRLSGEGEVLVRGPNVMRGYWRDTNRTAEVVDPDGWYHTGDEARIDVDGNIFLLGRIKELIVLPSGMKVWPSDVEDALRANPAVNDAVVIAVPTGSGGATLHAYLIANTARTPGVDVNLQAIISEANGHLAQHQRLASASWWLEPDFPRTSTLKIRRHVLPLPTTTDSVRINAAMASDDPVAQAIAAVAHVHTVQGTQLLGDLGLDSLALVELAVALEDKTGKRIGDTDLRLELSVDQVRELVARASSAEEGGADDDAGSAESSSLHQPLWPYTRGRALRVLGLPIDLVYRWSVTRTVVLGDEHLAGLTGRIILAGTHHSRADVSLVKWGLEHSPARCLAHRLIIAAAATTFARGILGWYGVLAFGLYPLRQYGARDASLRRLMQLAEAGNAVLIFPQGTYATPEQEVNDDAGVRFRPGVAHLALSLGASVVPFGLAGTQRLMPPTLAEYRGPLVVAGRPIAIRRGPLAIAFGPPLTLAPSESPQQFTERLQAASYALTRQAERALERA